MIFIWIDGKLYKSLNFTVLEDKIDDRSKTQTYRTNFIPYYKDKEIVALTHKKVFKYFIRIERYYPKQIKNLTLEEAKRDGFESVKEFQNGIMKINNIKDIEHWGFIIQYQPLKSFESKNLLDY